MLTRLSGNNVKDVEIWFMNLDSSACILRIHCYHILTVNTASQSAYGCARGILLSRKLGIFFPAFLTFGPSVFQISHKGRLAEKEMWRKSVKIRCFWSNMS